MPVTAVAVFSKSWQTGAPSSVTERRRAVLQCTESFRSSRSVMQMYHQPSPQAITTSYYRKRSVLLPTVNISAIAAGFWSAGHTLAKFQTFWCLFLVFENSSRILSVFLLKIMASLDFKASTGTCKLIALRTNNKCEKNNYANFLYGPWTLGDVYFPHTTLFVSIRKLQNYTAAIAFAIYVYSILSNPLRLIFTFI